MSITSQAIIAHFTGVRHNAYKIGEDLIAHVHIVPCLYGFISAAIVVDSVSDGIPVPLHYSPYGKTQDGYGKVLHVAEWVATQLNTLATCKPMPDVFLEAFPDYVEPRDLTKKLSIELM